MYLLIIFIFTETKEVLHMSTYADVSFFDCTEIPQFNLQVRVNTVEETYVTKKQYFDVLLGNSDIIRG